MLKAALKDIAFVQHICLGGGQPAVAPRNRDGLIRVGSAMRKEVNREPAG